ncbi:hypothetical protein PBY51_018634 [Eleginops maclovinus]|uniref:Uncharacterized protein n=1 Tax=Eleginops maclovinus TaxID=56733 RepID=A0AAN8AYC6_ELEMC|nr:hypothetical protein PBY51_018634 [Eleginops maclovinus]
MGTKQADNAARLSLPCSGNKQAGRLSCGTVIPIIRWQLMRHVAALHKSKRELRMHQTSSGREHREQG